MALNDMLKKTYMDGYKKGGKDTIVAVIAVVDKLKELDNDNKIKDGVSLLDLLCDMLKEQKEG